MDNIAWHLIPMNKVTVTFTNAEGDGHFLC